MNDNPPAGRLSHRYASRLGRFTDAGGPADFYGGALICGTENRPNCRHLLLRPVAQPPRRPLPRYTTAWAELRIVS